MFIKGHVMQALTHVKKKPIWELPQKNAGALKKDTLCASCAQKMMQGSSFSWVKVNVSTGPKVSSGSREVVRPGHVNALCRSVSYRLHDAKRELESIKKILVDFQDTTPAMPAIVMETWQQTKKDLEAEILELPNYIY